jgi:hypothetical protein
MTVAFLTPLSSSAEMSATIGSMSTYTTRASAATACTTSWVFPTVGSPDPTSMNCRIPCSASQRAARWWKLRFAQAASGRSGRAVMIRCAAIRSAGKLCLPPR